MLIISEIAPLRDYTLVSLSFIQCTDVPERWYSRVEAAERIEIFSVRAIANRNCSRGYS
jgi:hypothetical protein